MNWKFQNTLYGLGRTNVAARYISSNFINFMDLQRCLIVPFINIFVDILHGLHSSADFDVNIYLKKTC